jgi:hypothetical protein
MLKGTLVVSLLRVSSRPASRLLRVQCQVWLFIVLDAQLVEGKKYFKYNA